jgi:uncharacterized membrane protein YgcG
MEMISAAAALSPAVRAEAGAEDRLETGGGRYGGGGASGTY